MNLYVGLDVGTTGVKGILVNEKGEILATANERLTMFTPQPAWAEQDPLSWWEAVRKILKNLSERSKEMGGKIRAISTSGQMHSLVVIDNNGKVLRNAILWCDQRTYKECEEATQILGGEENVLKLVGNPILPGFTLPKILWIRKHEPEIYGKISKIMLPKDFINYMLTGEMKTEHSDASGTVMYSVSKMEWNKDVLKELNIPESVLPEIIPSNGVVGNVKPEVASDLGLSEDTLVIGGGADNACAALGIAVVEPGDVMVSLGTSGTVLAPTKGDQPDPKGRVHFFAHTVPETRYHMGVMLSATYSLEWFKEKFLSEDYETINEEVDKVPVGSNGIIFLPYLNGERTPHRDPFARGVFFGISSYNTKWDMVRAIFEGVAFGIKDSFDILRELKVDLNNVRITGGGSKSRVWNKMLADMTGLRIQKPAVDEGASYGAAILAVSGSMGENPAKISKEWFRVKSYTDPVVENTEIYEKLHEKFKKLYASLKEMFRS
ncbi:MULTISPECIES: xylulokinase [unclassified Thermotoga]|uniref:xylulokinase n=1 Tax=unclassified Thermotoga TaxID=2631113 RepID=UPI000280EAF1|nr:MULTISPECIES: xylulokinase [unclassified Thermotoga]AIY86388.1 xylulokinase [Thermotoga sp. 2812B]EJX26324.1 xylulokinase [Thermotoga sp. EMP]